MSNPKSQPCLAIRVRKIIFVLIKNIIIYVLVFVNPTTLFLPLHPKPYMRLYALSFLLFFYIFILITYTINKKHTSPMLNAVLERCVSLCLAITIFGLLMQELYYFFAINVQRIAVLAIVSCSSVSVSTFI